MVTIKELKDILFVSIFKLQQQHLKKNISIAYLRTQKRLIEIYSSFYRDYCDSFIKKMGVIKFSPYLRITDIKSVLFLLDTINIELSLMVNCPVFLL